MTSEAFGIKALVSAPRAGEAPGPVPLHSVVLEGWLLGWGPESPPAPPAQLPESTDIAPPSVTVGNKCKMFEMFKISGSVSKAAQMAFPEGCCYLYSTIGDSGDSKTNKS